MIDIDRWYRWYREIGIGNSRTEFMVSHQSCEFSLAEARGPNMKFTSSFFRKSSQVEPRGSYQDFRARFKPVEVNREWQWSKSRHRKEIIQIAMDQNHATLIYPVFFHIKIAAIHRILVAWIFFFILGAPEKSRHAPCIRHTPKRPSSMRCWGAQHRKQTATTWEDQRSKDANSKKLRL